MIPRIMARRKKNSNFLKNFKFKFKIKKKTWKAILTLSSAFAVIGFAVWLSYHAPKKTAPAKSLKKTSLPSKIFSQKPTASKPPAEPIVYYKPTRQPAAVFSQPPLRRLSSGPKLVFVLDDMGNTDHHMDELIKLGDQVTYAVLPLLKHSSKFAHLSRQTGAEVILHLPLESSKGTIPGPGLITTTMSKNRVLEELDRNLDSVPYRTGVNNHMGSKGTSNESLMSIILPELKARGYFFLDSMTTSKSVAASVAREIGIPFLKRDEFLDNEDTMPAIREEVRMLAEKARRKGYGIGIGHYRLNTLKVLQDEIPKLEREGFQTISLRDLIAYKKTRNI